MNKSAKIRLVPFAAISADEEFINANVGIRVSHPIAISRIMRFPMLPKHRLEFELLAAAVERANVLDVAVFLVLSHCIFALEGLLALFQWAKNLQICNSIQFQMCTERMEGLKFLNSSLSKVWNKSK